MTPPWLIPDPDESEDGDICLCDVCGTEVPKKIVRKRIAKRRARTDLSPKALKRNRMKHAEGSVIECGYDRDPTRPVVCTACRDKGWRGKWCACGAVMHKRDYPQAHRRVGACGKCRAEMYESRRADAA